MDRKVKGLLSRTLFIGALSLLWKILNYQKLKSRSHVNLTRFRVFRVPEHKLFYLLNSTGGRNCFSLDLEAHQIGRRLKNGRSFSLMHFHSAWCSSNQPDAGCLRFKIHFLFVINCLELNFLIWSCISWFNLWTFRHGKLSTRKFRVETGISRVQALPHILVNFHHVEVVWQLVLVVDLHW